jgi:hypothetical protein
MSIAKTTEYDPRYNRAQTIEGAKARYVQVNKYTLADLERDLERILREGEPEYTWSELTEPEMGYI